MCGIVGAVDLRMREVPETVIANMSASLRHRGPDGEGHWRHENVALGHTRLAIMDLSHTADQPMTSGDGRWTIVYNGELWNFRELRRELESLGQSFRGTGDTEVLVAALSVWGPDLIPRLNGMFAFAAYDRLAQRLLLGRDRYGIKPLYVMRQGNWFAFASEHRAFQSLPGFISRVDALGIQEYLTFQNFLSDRTMVEDVHLFPPGCFAEIDCTDADGTFAGTPYWDFAFTEPNEAADPRAYEDELARLFRTAVQRSLISDVEVGSYLSSGVDSASISTVAAEAGPLKTFTCGFHLPHAAMDGRAGDERGAASEMARVMGATNFSREIGPSDLIEQFDAISSALEEPRVGQSYPNFEAARLARSHVKVVLSGAGGDELFGGYPWRYFPAVTAETTADFLKQYWGTWTRIIPETDTQAALVHADRSWSRSVFSNLLAAEDAGSISERLNSVLRFEAKTFLAGLLMVEDKLSMAHGLEARLPFLDNDFVDFALQVPSNLKVRPPSGPGRPTSGKLLLRAALSKLLPAHLTAAPKQGFSGPDAHWFRSDLRDFVDRRLKAPDSPLFDHVHRHYIQDVWQQHLSGNANNRLAIWSFLSLDQALRSHS